MWQKNDLPKDMVFCDDCFATLRVVLPPKHFRKSAVSKNIALVEDDPAIRENYADALKRSGYTV